MVYDPSQMSSLRWNLREMRRTALHLKERLSADTWRVLQQLETQFSGFVPSSADARVAATTDLLDGVVVSLSAFSGLLMENTTRGYGWRFLEIGRRMERALQSAELLRSSFSSAPTELEPFLQVLLQIADSSITYRTRYPTVLQADLVLEVLLADTSNPRAVGFQLATLFHQINRLQELNTESTLGPEHAMTAKVLATIRDARLADIAQRNAAGSFEALEDLVGQLKLSLYEISDALTTSYLSPVKASRLTASW
jgi:uncharacterized alpha-E superfamily protein